MSVINVEDIAHVRFSAPDLVAMRSYLDDFGLSSELYSDGRLYARSRDGRPFVHVTETGEPRFLGLGLLAKDVNDLQLLAAAENVSVEEFDAPGGGQVVRLADPDGFVVEVVAAQSKVAAEVDMLDVAFNTAHQRTRIGRLEPVEPRPSHVLRIAHCGLGVTDFRRSERWYKERFGFITSDEIETAPDQASGGFLRCDLGSRPVDHHTLVFAQYPKRARLLHAAFEVANFEDLMLGQAYLRAKGREHVWGVGRHILGGQIFDYWQDPWGHELEHWADGDLLTADDAPRKVPISVALKAQWGPAHPSLTAVKREKP